MSSDYVRRRSYYNGQKSYIALEKAIESVKMELEQIGLNFSIFKSRVTTSSEGFEYLGCRIFQRDVGKYRQPKGHIEPKSLEE